MATISDYIEQAMRFAPTTAVQREQIEARLPVLEAVHEYSAAKTAYYEQPWLPWTQWQFAGATVGLQSAFNVYQQEKFYGEATQAAQESAEDIVGAGAEGAARGIGTALNTLLMQLSGLGVGVIAGLGLLYYADKKGWI